MLPLTVLSVCERVRKRERERKKKIEKRRGSRSEFSLLQTLLNF